MALVRRLRETNERVARQSFQTVPSRVAGVLAQLIAEDALPEGREGITVRMTQADLAQLAGTSRESVSRFLATLERAGVVAVGRGRVTVVQPRRLRSYIFCRRRWTSTSSGRAWSSASCAGGGSPTSGCSTAMGTVPRELFVPKASRTHSYSDGALAIGHDQTISQPWIVAAMCEALELAGTESVLEIGTGSGYSAAVLSLLAREVMSVELVPELAAAASEVLGSLGTRNVEIVEADGSGGLPEHAGRSTRSRFTPRRRRPPTACWRQLAPGGRLVVPIAIGNVDMLTVFSVLGDGGESVPARRSAPARFVPAAGQRRVLIA